MDWITVLGYVFSALTGVAGWLAGRKQQNNNFLKELQESINMLAEKNHDLLDEVVRLRTQNADLLTNQETMKREIEGLRRENKELKEEIAELNQRLDGIKTITRNKITP